MRRAVPRLILLLLALAAVPTLAGDIERAQELIESVGFDDPRFTELHDLARKPAVRKWLWTRVRELWKVEDDSGGVEPYFLVLVRTGAGREEVQFLVDAAARRSESSYSYFSRFAERLLERAPLSLDVEPLLDPLARRAASAFHDDEAADSIWLLAHRLPRDRVVRALEAAWKEATPLERRKQPPGWGYAELTLLGPDGKPPEGLLWIRDMGSWNPSQAIVWPDGKARCANWFREDEKVWEPEIRISLPGFQESEKMKLSFRKGEVSRAEVRLGERRARVRGTLAPAPRVPLFARLHSGLTVGNALDPYRMNRGELSIPVRSDGAFEATANRQGKALLILDIDGNVFHVQPVDVPAGGADVDLGEVKLPARRDLADVPIHVDWPAALPRGESFQGSLTWKSEDPNVPPGRTSFSAGSGKAGEKAFVGLARNVPPGKYVVTAKFIRTQNQGEVTTLEMPFTVKGAKDTLVLKPEKGKDAPAPTAAAPTGAGVPVGDGSLFLLRRSASGQVHLLTADSRGIVHRAREGESFGAERVLFKAPPARKDKGAPEAWTSSMDLVPDKDGSLHVFRLTQVTQDHRALYYARAPRAGGQPPRWLQLADVRSPNDDYADPTVLVRKNGALEVYAPVMRIRKESDSSFFVEGLRLFRAVIQGGRPRALPSIQLANWDVSLDPDAKVLATPGAEAHALHPGRAQSLTWTNLASMAETPAGEVPDVNHFAQASIGLGPRGEVYLALPLQEKGGESPRYWIGSARIGERFTARGILEGSFSRSRQTSLAMTPKGEVYLVASLRRPAKDDGQVALWHLSGTFPPQPILTPWLDSSIAAPQAVFIEERKALVAWGRGEAIHVEAFALPDP